MDSAGFRRWAVGRDPRRPRDLPRAPSPEHPTTVVGNRVRGSSGERGFRLPSLQGNPHPGIHGPFGPWETESAVASSMLVSLRKRTVASLLRQLAGQILKFVQKRSYLDWICRLLCSIRSYASSILLSRSSTLSDVELGRLGVEGMGAGWA